MKGICKISYLFVNDYETKNSPAKECVWCGVVTH